MVSGAFLEELTARLLAGDQQALELIAAVRIESGVLDENHDVEQMKVG